MQITLETGQIKGLSISSLVHDRISLLELGPCWLYTTIICG